MALQHHRKEVQRLLAEIAELQRKLSDHASHEAARLRDLDRLGRTHHRSVSSRSGLTDQHRISTTTDDLARIHRRKGGLAQRLAAKTTQLHRAQEALARDEAAASQRVIALESRLLKDRHAQERAFMLDMQRAGRGSFAPGSEARHPRPANVSYDAFICHASEDKDEFVRPLARALQVAGFRVWYDEFSLSVGDSLRRSIDQGLLDSRYGIVILSSAFFSKNWPQCELDGLVEREMQGRKVVLPIWHKVSKEEVASYSPSLADKFAITTAIYTIPEIVAKLGEVLRHGDA